jgi:hypothetical protein
MLNRFIEEYRKLKKPTEQSDEISKTFLNFEQEYKLLPAEPIKPYSLLQVLRKTRDEESYSDILAYFLDPARPHGLGRIVLDAFLTTIGIEEHEPEEVYVEREYPLQNRFIDILIKTTSWVVVIENKIDSPESERQTTDLYNGVFQDDELKEKEYKKFIFLTPEGLRPRDDNFESLSYDKLFKSIERQALNLLSKTPITTSVYLADFLRTIKEELMQEKGNKDTFSKKSMLYIKYYKEIDDVRSSFDEDWKVFKTELPSILTKDYGLNETEWNFSGTTTYYQLHKKNWYTNNIYVHFEFWSDGETISEDSIPFMVDVEGKGRENFFKIFNGFYNKHKLKELCKKMNIQYRQENRKTTLVYKKYPLKGNMNKLPEIIKQAFGEFCFLIEHIDNTLAKLKR